MVPSLRNLCASLALAACAACAAPKPLALDIPPLERHLPRTSPVDIEHYALKVALDPRARSLEGECRIRFHPRHDLVQVLELDLDTLDVAGVRDEEGRSISFERRPGVVAIDFGAPLEAGTSHEVVIRYGGVPRRGLWFAGERDGLPTHAFTQGQCDDSRGWFPCWDEPAERATSELEVTLPAGWISLAAGEKVESLARPDGGTVDLWRMNVPHPAYLTTLVAGELVEVRSSWNGVPLSVVAEPKLDRHLEASFEPTAEILRFFEDLTGARYPFAKYSQAAVANFPHGGMENISATTLTDACVGDERARRDYDPTGLIAHEAAHQWFGNLLTCADWSQVWLNEGFATYGELLYREATAGRDDFRAALRDVQDFYVAQDTGAQRRPHVWDQWREPFDLFTRGGQAYQGAASRLHLLRFQLGDAAFFRGLRRYVADHRGRAVVTDEFRRSMEQESGLDLAPFFQQWFTRPGYPEFEVRWSWSEARRSVRVEVEQVQASADGTPAVFVLPVDIEVRDAAGARRTRVTIDERREVIELAAPQPPTWVVFDKHGWVPKRCRTERSTDEWLELASESDDVNERREALLELGMRLATEPDEDRRWTIAETLLDGLGHSCESVRLAAARSFGRVHTTVDHPIAQELMGVASGDRSARVRVAALETLAAWETRSEFVRFAREQYAAEFSPATMGAAARLVALCEGEDALPWLLSQLERESLHDGLRAALVPALASVRGSRSLEALQRWLLDESWGVAAREAAARALVSSAKGRSDLSREASALLERTDLFRLQLALVDLLAAIDDGRARAALARFHGRSVDSRSRRAIEAHFERAKR